MSDFERRQRHAEWVAATIERLGPRPECRLTRPRSFEDEVPTNFSEFVASMLLDTPDDVIVGSWRTYPVCDTGLRLC